MLQPWNAVFLDLQRQVDEVFEELIYRRWSRTSATPWQPPLDLCETVDAYHVEVDVPAVAPGNLRLFVDGQRLIITGERSTCCPEGASVNRRERPSGVFHRVLEFPHPIDPEHVEAEYRLGTCRIRLPKKMPADEPATTSYEIQVTLR